MSKTSERISHFLAWHKHFAGRSYVLDDVSQPILEKMETFFSQKHRKKGLLLQGPIGVGKTTLMRYFGAHALEKRFKVIGTGYICRAYQEKGNEAFQHYATIYHYPGYPSSEDRGWCLDDLGAESSITSTFYGTKIVVIQDLVHAIYERHELHGWYHATTNLSGKQLESLYGQRAASRMCELFEVIKFPRYANDRRKSF